MMLVDLALVDMYVQILDINYDPPCCSIFLFKLYGNEKFVYNYIVQDLGLFVYIDCDNYKYSVYSRNF